jgi:hypothetical protein
MQRRSLLRAVAGIIGISLWSFIPYVLLNLPGKPVYERIIFATGCLSIGFHFIAYAVSKTYGKRLEGKDPRAIRFKDDPEP